MEAQIEEAEDISLYLIPKDVPISLLDVTAAFSALTPQVGRAHVAAGVRAKIAANVGFVQEKCYAHYIAQASWSGSLICLFQVRPLRRCQVSPLVRAVLTRVSGDVHAVPARIRRAAGEGYRRCCPRQGVHSR